MMPTSDYVKSVPVAHAVRERAEARRRADRGISAAARREDLRRQSDALGRRLAPVVRCRAPSASRTVTVMWNGAPAAKNTASDAVVACGLASVLAEFAMPLSRKSYGRR